MPATLRHGALRLALTIVACVNQESLNAYFLRRDLFSTLVKVSAISGLSTGGVADLTRAQFSSDPATSAFALEPFLLLGLLANYHKHAARNPYRVRIEDCVDEGLMTALMTLTSAACARAVDAYERTPRIVPPTPSDTAQGAESTGIAHSLASIWYSLRLAEIFSLRAWSLPPPIDRETDVDEGKAVDRGRTSSPSSVRPRAASKAASAPASGTSDATLTEAPATPAGDVEFSQDTPAAPSPHRGPLPPDELAVLLPFFEFTYANKAFAPLLFADTSDEINELPSRLITLASHLAYHARVLCAADVSATHPARVYARLSLMLLTLIVEDGEHRLTTTQASLRLHRQQRAMEKPLIAGVLDVVVAHVRQSAHKRMDVEGTL